MALAELGRQLAHERAADLAGQAFNRLGVVDLERDEQATRRPADAFGTVEWPDCTSASTVRSPSPSASSTYQPRSVRTSRPSNRR